MRLLTYLKEEKGQAIIETLIVFPLLIGILVTIIFFGKFGDKLTRAHFAANALAFGIDDKSKVWEPEDKAHINERSGRRILGNIFNDPDADGFLGLIDWIRGKREGIIELEFRGRIAGMPQITELIEVKQNVSYNAIHNTWKVDPLLVHGLFVGIGALIVFGNINVANEAHRLWGREPPEDIEEAVKNEWNDIDAGDNSRAFEKYKHFFNFMR